MVAHGWERRVVFFGHTLDDIEDSALKELIGLLRLPGNGGPIAITGSWLRRQADESRRLHHSLRQPSDLADRFAICLGKWKVPFSPDVATLCTSHDSLDPRLVRELFVLILSECLGWGKLGGDEVPDGPVKAWASRLAELAALHFGEEEVERLYNIPLQHYDTHMMEANRVYDACQLAVIVSWPRALKNLSAGMKARCKSEAVCGHGKLGTGSPGLMRAIEFWLADHQQRMQNESNVPGPQCRALSVPEDEVETEDSREVKEILSRQASARLCSAVRDSGSQMDEDEVYYTDTDYASRAGPISSVTRAVSRWSTDSTGATPAPLNIARIREAAAQRSQATKSNGDTSSQDLTEAASSSSYVDNPNWRSLVPRSLVPADDPSITMRRPIPPPKDNTPANAARPRRPLRSTHATPNVRPPAPLAERPLITTSTPAPPVRKTASASRAVQQPTTRPPAPLAHRRLLTQGPPDPNLLTFHYDQRKAPSHSTRRTPRSDSPTPATPNSSTADQRDQAGPRPQHSHSAPPPPRHTSNGPRSLRRSTRQIDES
jgi:hypothetical protein